MTELSWTNSSLNTLQDCGEKFRRTYIEREYRGPRSYFVRGNALDFAVTTSMKRKMLEGTLPTREETRDLAATAFTNEWAGGVEFTDDEVEEGISKIRDREKDAAVELASLHLEKVAPGVTPIGVQRRVVVKPAAMDITIQGTEDLLDAQPDGTWVRDTKSRKASPPKDEALTTQQLPFYSLLHYAETKTLPVRGRLDVLVRTPARGDLKYVPLDMTPTMADLDFVMRRLNTGVEAVKKGVFMPANPSWWGCSESYCPFWGDCVYARRGASRPQS